MQQSCPKNVHTGPHIGSNSNNTSNSSNNVNHTHNGSNSTSANLSGSNNNNTNSSVTAMTNNCNINNNNSNSLNASILHHSNNKSSATTNDTSTVNNNRSNNNSSNNNNSTTMTMNANNNNNQNNAMNTNRGPVKNVTTIASETRTEPSNNIPLLTIAVKTELSSVDDTDNKSQYEENVVTPLTPPDSYSTNEDKLGDSVEKDTVSAINLEQDVEEAIDKLQAANTVAVSTNPVEAYDLTTTTPPLIGKNVSSVAPPANAIPSPQMTVGRRARIGKSMAWNMVYAGAATTLPNVNPIPGSNTAAPPAQPPCLPTRIASQSASPIRNAGPPSLPAKSNAPLMHVSTPEHNVNNALDKAPGAPTSFCVNNVMTKQEIEEIRAPLLLKAEIKSEKIKLEDDILDTMLLQHTNVAQHGTQQSLQKHIIQEKNELKIIKAEPITLSEILHESKVKIEHDCEILVPPESMESTPEHKHSNTRQESPATLKCQGRMRLLPSWQQPINAAPSPLPAVNCDIDLSNTSDDEVLDLCHSPVAGSSTKCSGKRIKILEFNKNQCKKSPPNSYKSLIKQAEPKMYLCLSRKFEKKSRFGRLHSSKSSKGASLNNGIRRRELLLTDQQKESLRMRKKKLMAMEKRRRESKEQRRAELKQRRKVAKALSGLCIKGELQENDDIKPDCAKLKEEALIVNLVEDEEPESGMAANTFTSGPNLTAKKEVAPNKSLQSISELNSSPMSTPKPSPKRGKPPKKPSIPLHLIETIDAVARGYFSEPECRTSLSTCSPSPIDLNKTTVEGMESRKPLAIKAQKKTKSTSEKRSKSETKKPLIGPDILKTDLIVRDTLTRPVLDTAQSVTTSKSVEQLNTNPIVDKTNDHSIELFHSEAPLAEYKIRISKKYLQKCRSKETKHKNREKIKHKKISQQKISKKSKTHRTSPVNDGTRLESPGNVPQDSMQIEDIQATDTNTETNNNEYAVETYDKESPKEAQMPLEATDSHLNTSIDVVPSTTLAGTVDTTTTSTTVTLNAQNAPSTTATTTLVDTITTTTSISSNSEANTTSLDTTPYGATVQQVSLQSQHSNGSTTPPPTTPPVFLQPTLPPMPRVVCHSHHQHGVKRNRSRSKFGSRKRQKLKHSTVSFELDETLPPATRMDVVPKWNNGWTWEGEQFQGAVFLNVS